MIYPYSNGKNRSENTHIKTMKQVSLQFKSFENMRIRITFDQSINQCKITKI
nr:transposase [Enterococcus faecium]